MNKTIIKKHLSKFMSEAKVPGVAETEKTQKKEDSVNKEYYKDVTKKMGDYDKAVTDDKDSVKKGDINKYTNDDEAKEYHDEFEIRNGQEMIKYGNEPSDKFKERAKAALEGDSKMGNKTYEGKWNPETGAGNGNTEEVWGASGGKHLGKELVKIAKASQKKRDKTTVASTVRTGKPVENEKSIAVENKQEIKKVLDEDIEKGKFTKWCKSHGFDGPSISCAKLAMSDKNDVGTHKMATFYMNTVQPKGKTMKDITETNNKTIKESNKMKRLKFKKPFNGIGKAIALIPEAYKVDGKLFEMTDGNENYRIRWEGSLNEGKAIAISASDKTLMNEDIQHMKHLMGFKSTNTLGIPTSKERVIETTTTFYDMLGKFKKLMTEDEKPEVEEPEGEESDVEVDDTDKKWYKADDDGDDEKEPDVKDIKQVALPVDTDDDDEIGHTVTGEYSGAKLFKSKQRDAYILVAKNPVGNRVQIDVPSAYLAIAQKNPNMALRKIIASMELSESVKK